MDGLITRWTQLYRASAVIQRYLNSEELNDLGRTTIPSLAKTLRSRLENLSCYVRCVHGYIARWVKSVVVVHNALPEAVPLLHDRLP